MTPSLASPIPTSADLPSLDPEAQELPPGFMPSDFVVSESRLSDADREIAIQRAGAAVEKHMAKWRETGCFAARGDADRALRLMGLLVKGRSPEVVARLERERGLL